LAPALPTKISQVITESRKAYSYQVFGSRKRAAKALHEFFNRGVEHSLTSSTRPNTNGVDERFNGLIEDVVQSDSFYRGEDLKQTNLRHVTLDN
jgi:transposase